MRQQKGFCSLPLVGVGVMTWEPRHVATQRLWTLISCQPCPGCVKTAVAEYGRTVGQMTDLLWPVANPRPRELTREKDKAIDGASGKRDGAEEGGLVRVERRRQEPHRCSNGGNKESVQEE